MQFHDADREAPSSPMKMIVYVWLLVITICLGSVVFTSWMYGPPAPAKPELIATKPAEVTSEATRPGGPSKRSEEPIKPWHVVTPGYTIQVKDWSILIKPIQYHGAVFEVEATNTSKTKILHIDHSMQLTPVTTDQYGNQLFVVNPSQVQANTSQVLIGFEMMALQNNVINATSPAKF